MVIEETWGKPAPGVDEFFELNGKVIRDFASNHNLIIEKYYHNIDGWKLIFQHPKGGACYIKIIKEDDQNVSFLGDWWVDDVATSTRYDKHTDYIKSSIENEVLADSIRGLFQQILSWEKDELIPVCKSYRPLIKEDVEADLAKYPVPINLD